MMVVTFLILIQPSWFLYVKRFGLIVMLLNFYYFEEVLFINFVYSYYNLSN